MAGRLRLGAAVFDPKSGEVWQDGRRQQLAPQPSALLTLLIHQAGELVSREDAYRAIWPDETFVDREHGLNHCVRQLRRALGDDARAPRFIETLPRRGYRLVAPVTAVEAPARTPPRRTRTVLRVACGAVLVVGSLLLGRGAVDRLRTDAGSAKAPATAVATTLESSGLVARDHYLRGRFLAARPSPSTLRRAIDHFHLALEADRTYASAGAALAAAYVDAVQIGMMPSVEGFRRAHAAASSALAIDLAQPEAYWARGMATLYRDLHWKSATPDFQRAARLGPEDARAHLWLARSQAASRAYGAAIATAETARVLDPTSETIVADLGWFYFFGQRFQDAADVCGEALELTPGSVAAAQCLLAARFALGNETATIEAGRRWLVSLGADAIVQADAAQAYHEGGRAAFWIFAARWLEGICAVGSLSVEAAAIYLHLGDTETALGQLERAVVQRLPWVPFLAIDPTFAPLRGHPRFDRLVAELDA